jgi:hypothetical protein
VRRERLSLQTQGFQRVCKEGEVGRRKEEVGKRRGDGEASTSAGGRGSCAVPTRQFAFTEPKMQKKRLVANGERRIGLMRWLQAAVTVLAARSLSLSLASDRRAKERLLVSTHSRAQRIHQEMTLDAVTSQLLSRKPIATAPSTPAHLAASPKTTKSGCPTPVSIGTILAACTKPA